MIWDLVYLHVVKLTVELFHTLMFCWQGAFTVKTIMVQASNSDTCRTLTTTPNDIRKGIHAVVLKLYANLLDTYRDLAKKKPKAKVYLNLKLLYS
jgi:hypothetical protein